MHAPLVRPKTLENIASSTEPKPAAALDSVSVFTAMMDSEDEMPQSYGVSVSWGELVDRMVRYLQAHNFDDASEKHSIRIFNVLR